jgi:hypothetical protein
MVSSHGLQERKPTLTARFRGRFNLGLALPLGGLNLPGVVEPEAGVVDFALWIVGGIIVFIMAGFYVWGMIKRRR